MLLAEESVPLLRAVHGLSLTVFNFEDPCY